MRLTMPLFQTDIPSRTYRISPFPSTVPTSSPKSTLSAPTTRYQLSHRKTAIITPFGLFEFLRMPFGLRNAAQTFQRFIDQVLHGLPFCYAYIDDLLIASSCPEEHQQHLRQVFHRLSEHGIIINPSKCRFGVSELEFLGHTVNSQGVRPSDTKVKAITDFPRPTSLRKLREFLGLVNLHHRFIPQCASILGPLNNLLTTPHGKDHTLEWTEAATTAFNKVKEALATATLLTHPKPFAPTGIMTDASDTAVGAVLQQQIDGDWQPIAYFSKKLRPAETRYSTFDRELLAIYLAIKHFRHFVEGREFHIATDHKPLTFALSTASDKYTPRQIRHLDYIAQFSTDIRYIAGHHNLVADALSRNAVCSLNATQPPTVDLQVLAKAQETDPEGGLKFQQFRVTWGCTDHSPDLQVDPSLVVWFSSDLVMSCVSFPYYITMLYMYPVRLSDGTYAFIPQVFSTYVLPKSNAASKRDHSFIN